MNSQIAVGPVSCSAASCASDEPLFATSATAGAWLLVEVRGAWGRDAFVESDLGPHIPDGWAKTLQKSGIRPLCVRSRARADATDVRLTFAIVDEPGGREPTLWRTDVNSLADVATRTAGLGVDRVPTGWSRLATPVLAVCTNGRRDQCCATEGRPVLRALRDRTDAEVWECSHIGGHRFAATFVDLPSGVCFGRCDAESAVGVVDSLRAGRIERDHFRGRSSLGEEAQAAEHHARDHANSWHVDDVRRVERVGSPDGHRWAVHLEHRVVQVELEPTELTLTAGVSCGAPPGERLVAYRVLSIASNYG